MERLSDLADSQKCTGASLFGFQRLVAVTLNQTSEFVRHKKAPGDAGALVDMQKTWDQYRATIGPPKV